MEKCSIETRRIEWRSYTRTSSASAMMRTIPRCLQSTKNTLLTAPSDQAASQLLTPYLLATSVLHSEQIRSRFTATELRRMSALPVNKLALNPALEAKVEAYLAANAGFEALPPPPPPPPGRKLLGCGGAKNYRGRVCPLTILMSPRHIRGYRCWNQSQRPYTDPSTLPPVTCN